MLKARTRWWSLSVSKTRSWRKVLRTRKFHRSQHVASNCRDRIFKYQTSQLLQK
jgi:hypothetical protein